MRALEECVSIDYGTLWNKLSVKKPLNDNKYALERRMQIQFENDKLKRQKLEEAKKHKQELELFANYDNMSENQIDEAVSKILSFYSTPVKNEKPINTIEHYFDNIECIAVKEENTNSIVITPITNKWKSRNKKGDTLVTLAIAKKEL